MAIYKGITKSGEIKTVGRAQPDKLVKYLKYKSDENGKYLKDEKGKRIPRTEHITALNVDKAHFCDECRDLAKEFGVNQGYDNLKYKHYVQAFCPEDSDLMTKEECHQLGVEFAKTFFGDFPVLIVTHFEQETELGEYHWHNHFVVYNCDVNTGKKIDTTGERMKEQKRYVVSQATAHGLTERGLRMKDGQLLSSKKPDRISTAEYYDRKYHQALLDKEKKLRPDARIAQHTYYTQLQELRIVIATAWQHAGGDQDTFRRYLRDVYGVETKIVRGGELSYLHPDRAKEDGTGWVRGRSLGNAYTWEGLQSADHQSHYRQITGTGGHGEPVERAGYRTGADRADVDARQSGSAAGSDKKIDGTEQSNGASAEGSERPDQKPTAPREPHL